MAARLIEPAHPTRVAHIPVADAASTIHQVLRATMTMSVLLIIPHLLVPYAFGLGVLQVSRAIGWSIDHQSSITRPVTGLYMSWSRASSITTQLALTMDSSRKF
jgi:hypothetical protein